MLRSRHSKRNEHTGENEPPKRKKKGTRYVEHSQLLPFEENSFTSSNVYKKWLSKSQKSKRKGMRKMKYIKNVETLEELKKAYKKLALKLHAECGGYEEEMKIL